MGFFSSRKEDSKTFAGVAGKEEKSVVQVLRSRFSNKKGKERQTAGPTSNSAPTSPSSGNKRGNRISLSTSITHRETPDRNSTAAETTDSSQKPTVLPTNRPSESSLAQHSNASSPSILPPRRSIDAVTVTLAQRLNELASANSDGLLNDDEYRILRQNLFDRFASSTAVPTEIPVVPAHPVSLPRGNGVTGRTPTKPVSNFRVERPQFTKSSANSLFRRATERRSKDNETSSLMSTKSSTSLFTMPKLLRKSSDISIRTTASRGQTDSMSVASRRQSSDRGHGDNLPQPSTPRSAAGSIRRMQVPPSSFNARLLAQERNTAIYNVFDEDYLSSVEEIQQEILNVEAEQKRLVDAFNGLEVTTLSRALPHRLPYRRSGEFSKTSTTSESVLSDSEGRFSRFPHLTDDGLSMRSGTSIRTSPSLAHSAHSSKNGLHARGTLPSPLAASQIPPLVRRGSADERRTPVAPVHNLISHGYLQTASSSNVSLHSKSSRLPVSVLSDDKSATTTHADEKEGLETELEEIRRRREEVSHRYHARLEYLRAKLKGAQLHQRLLRR